MKRNEPRAWRYQGQSQQSVSNRNNELEDRIRSFAIAAQRLLVYGDDDDNNNTNKERRLEERTGDAERYEKTTNEFSSLRVNVTIHDNLGDYMASKPNIVAASDNDVVVNIHAFLEPEWTEFDRPLANSPTGMWTYVHEKHPDDNDKDTSAASVYIDWLRQKPTLCLKLKRKEMVWSILNKKLPPLTKDSEDDEKGDPNTAARVNELAWRWSLSSNSNETCPKNTAVLLEFAPDRELQDVPDKPIGNKGGLYIESRIQFVPKTESNENGDQQQDQQHHETNDNKMTTATTTVQVISPTITTKLSHPEFIRGNHYMKCVPPF